jgi:hypothetical protein
MCAPEGKWSCVLVSTRRSCLLAEFGVGSSGSNCPLNSLSLPTPPPLHLFTFLISTWQAMRLTLPRLHSARGLLATPSQVASLITSTAHASRCPCHQCTSPSPVQAQHSLLGGLRRMGSSIVEKEYAFEVSSSFGRSEGG